MIRCPGKIGSTQPTKPATIRLIETTQAAPVPIPDHMSQPRIESHIGLVINPKPPSRNSRAAFAIELLLRKT